MFRFPAAKSPHTENTFSTSACDAGATGLAPHEQEVETSLAAESSR